MLQKLWKNIIIRLKQMMDLKWIEKKVRKKCLLEIDTTDKEKITMVRGNPSSLHNLKY